MNRNDWLDLELVDRIVQVASLSFPTKQVVRPGRTRIYQSRRPHHTQDSGDESQEQEDDQAPGRYAEQPVDAPPDRGADNDAGDKIGPEPQRQGISLPGLLRIRPRRTRLTRRVAFVKPPFEITQSIGERAIVGRSPAGRISVIAVASTHPAKLRPRE